MLHAVGIADPRSALIVLKAAREVRQMLLGGFQLLHRQLRGEKGPVRALGPDLDHARCLAIALGKHTVARFQRDACAGENRALGERFQGFFVSLLTNSFRANENPLGITSQIIRLDGGFAGLCGARERAERERIEREKEAARQAAERERVEREKAEQERLARERAEQDKLAREAAERERIEQEKQKAALAAAERERLNREQAERERVAGEQREAARPKEEAKVENVGGPARTGQAEQQTPSASPAEIQTAMLVEPPKPVSAIPSPLTGSALVEEIKKELQRVGCYAGRLDDKWTTAETTSSVQKFVKYANLPSLPQEPALELLEALRGKHSLSHRLGGNNFRTHPPLFLDWCRMDISEIAPILTAEKIRPTISAEKNGKLRVTYQDGTITRVCLSGTAF